MPTGLKRAAKAVEQPFGTAIIGLMFPTFARNAKQGSMQRRSIGNGSGVRSRAKVVAQQLYITKIGIIFRITAKNVKIVFSRTDINFDLIQIEGRTISYLKSTMGTGMS